MEWKTRNETTKKVAVGNNFVCVRSLYRAIELLPIARYSNINAY
jgi:hypothetical protein